jgi:hypothetical protein
MTDIASEAAAFAGIIGQPPPSLETVIDLLDYAENIALTLNGRALMAELLFNDLVKRLAPDGQRLERFEDLRDGQTKSLRRKSRLAGLAERREQQLKAQKRHGQKTRERVEAAQRVFADRPKRDQAALIAKRLNMPVRTVRYVLQSINNILK